MTERTWIKLADKFRYFNSSKIFNAVDGNSVKKFPAKSREWTWTAPKETRFQNESPYEKIGVYVCTYCIFDSTFKGIAVKVINFIEREINDLQLR
jgi:hypothetical protein